MKENRYFQMIYLLLEKGSMSAPQLAEHFEVSVRTIYRDIDILSSAGIPIYATPGKGGGIRIQENFILNKSILSEQEQKQILMALQGNMLVDEDKTNTLLTKLGSVFQKQNMQWFEIDFSTWTKSNAKKEAFQLLQSAIFQRKRITFDYHNGNNETMKRTVEPLKLVFKSTDWYLYGFCLLRNDYRFFRLTRIRNLVMSNEEYTRTIPEQIFERSNNFEMRTIKVSLLFDKRISFHVYDKFDDEVIEKENGNLYVETIMPDNELLYEYILSCGDKVEVLAPQHIRKEVEQRIKRMLEIYIT